MKPASTTRSGRGASMRSAQRALEAVAVARAACHGTDASLEPKSRAAASPATSGAVGDHDSHVARRSARARQARAIAAMLEPRPEIRIASRSGARCRRSFVDDDAASAVADLTDDLRGLAARVQELRPPPRACAAGTITTMPMPQLKVRYISAESMRAGALQPVEHRIARPAARARSTTSSPRGSTRGMLSVRPPPVMCARPCTGSARISASSDFT